jgi:hypothetical protein
MTMFAKKIAAVLVLTATAAAPGLVLAASPHAHAHAHCILTEHRVTQVKPLRVTERYGRGSSERLVGAEVFVQAERGLTAEWLELTLQRHITQMSKSSMKDCALDAKDIKISVRSAGPGFAVKLAGKDATQAKEILRRAELLLK